MIELVILVMQKKGCTFTEALELLGLRNQNENIGR